MGEQKRRQRNLHELLKQGFRKIKICISGKRLDVRDTGNVAKQIMSTECEIDNVERQIMFTECEIDRLSALPDNILICNILSTLPIIDVIRTSLLSARWRSLWKQVPNLDFSEEFFRSHELNCNFELNCNCNDIIRNILLLHSGHIERFSIDNVQPMISPSCNPNILLIHHLGFLKEVKHMSLCGYYREIPLSLFACCLLRDLELKVFKFTGIPTEFDGFRSLQSLSLSKLEDLTNEGLTQLIGLCPLLHKLVLSNIWQLINLEIKSPSLNCLVLSDYYDLINVKIKAPNLNCLKILSCNYMESLTADCTQLVELEIEYCKRLIELKMNSCVLFHELHNSDVQIFKEHPMLNSLRKLSVKACIRVPGHTLLNTLVCFRNLEEVHIKIFEDYYYFEQERANGELVADSTLPSLKKAYVDISSAMKKEEEIMLLFLLNNAVSLNTITVSLPYCPANIHDKEFINKVLDLQKIYQKVNISMKRDEKRLDATCRHYQNMQEHRLECD